MTTLRTKIIAMDALLGSIVLTIVVMKLNCMMDKFIHLLSRTVSKTIAEWTGFSTVYRLLQHTTIQGQVSH